MQPAHLSLLYRKVSRISCFDDQAQVTNILGHMAPFLCPHFLSVEANVDCEVDTACSHLGDEPLGVSVREFLGWVD